MTQVAGISVSGPEAAHVVVMLHMSGVNRHMWGGVVPLLDDSLRCVTVDLPGFGDLAGEDFTVDSATERVGTVCDSLGVERVALVGLSLGGYIAQSYAAANPERVTGILISGASDPFNTVKAAGFKLFGSLIPLLLPIVGKRAIKGYADSLRKDLDPRLAEAIINGGLSPRAGAQVFRRIPGRDYARALVGYSGPIVVANGENDRPNRNSEDRFLGLFPHAESIPIPDARHAAPLDQPEAFAAAVRRLLELATKR